MLNPFLLFDRIIFEVGTGHINIFSLPCCGICEPLLRIIQHVIHYVRPVKWWHFGKPLQSLPLHLRYPCDSSLTPLEFLFQLGRFLRQSFICIFIVVDGLFLFLVYSRVSLIEGIEGKQDILIVVVANLVRLNLETLKEEIEKPLIQAIVSF